MTKTVCICDVTGEEGALTFVYPTGEAQIDPASAKVEYYVERSIDLSHKGALRVMYAIATRFNSTGPNYTMSREEFAAIVDGSRKKRA